MRRTSRPPRITWSTYAAATARGARQTKLHNRGTSLEVRGARRRHGESVGTRAHLVLHHVEACMTASRILIVEDFADSRDMYMEFLETQGFEVSGAAEGLAALKSIEDARPDVVVLDVALPK